MALQAALLVSAARALGWSLVADEIEASSVVGVALRRRVQALLGPLVRQISATPDARPATAAEAYWVTAQDRERQRYVFLAGPFQTHGAALGQVPEVKRWLDQHFGHDMDATFAATGTAFGPRNSVPVFLPGGSINPTWEAKAKAGQQAWQGVPETPSGNPRPTPGSRDAEAHAEYRADTLTLIKRANLGTVVPPYLAKHGFLGFEAPTVESGPDTYLDVGSVAQPAVRMTFASGRIPGEAFVLTLAVADNDTYTLRTSRLYGGRAAPGPEIQDRYGSFALGEIHEDMYLDQAADPTYLIPSAWLWGLLPTWTVQELTLTSASGKALPGARSLVNALLSGGLASFLRSNHTHIQIPGGGTWEDLALIKVPYEPPAGLSGSASDYRAFAVQHVSRGTLDNQAVVVLRESPSTPGSYVLVFVAHTAVGWKLTPTWKADDAFSMTWAENLIEQGHIARMRDRVGALVGASLTPEPRAASPKPAPRTATPALAPRDPSVPPRQPPASPQQGRIPLSPHGTDPGSEDLYKVPVGSIAREGVLAHGAKKAGKPDEARRYWAKVRPNRWKFLILEDGPTAKEDRTYRAMTGLSVAQQKKVDRYLDAHPEARDGEDIPPSVRREIAGVEEHESFDPALSRFVSDRASERQQWAPTRLGKADLTPVPRLRLDSTDFPDDAVAGTQPYLLVRGDGDSGESTLFRRYQEAVRLDATLSKPVPDAWRRPATFEALPVLVGTAGKTKWRVRMGHKAEEEVTTPEFVSRLPLLPGGPLLRGSCSLAFFMVSNDANIRDQKVHDLNAAISQVHVGRVGNPQVKLSEILQKGEIPPTRFSALWSFYLGKEEPSYVWWIQIMDDTLERADYLRVTAGSRPGDYYVEGGTWTGSEEAAEPHPVWHWRPSWWASLGDRGYPTLRLTFGPTGVTFHTVTGPEVKLGPSEPSQEPTPAPSGGSPASPQPVGMLRNKDLIYLLQTVVLNNGDTAALAPLGSPDSPEMRYLLDRGFLLPPVARGPGRFRLTPEGERALATGVGLPNAAGSGGKSLDRPLGWSAFSAELTFRYAVEARAALHNRDLDNEGRWFRTIELNKLALRATDLPGASKSEAKEILAYALATQGLLQADPGDSVGAADPLLLDPVDFVTMVRTEDDGWRVKLFPQGFEGGDGLPRAVLEWRRGEIWSGRVNAPQVGRVSLKPEDENAYRARTAAGIYSRLARQAYDGGKTIPDHAIPMLGLNVQIEQHPTWNVHPVPSVGSVAEDFPGAWRGRWGLFNIRQSSAAGSYPSYVEAQEAAGREMARDQEWKAGVAAEKAKFPVLNVDPKDPKSGYTKRLASYGSHSEFWEAPHVADIRQPHGHDVQVHVLGNRLTRSHAYNAGSRHDLLLFTVDVPGLGDALVWRDTDEARKVKSSLGRSGIQVASKPASPQAGSYMGYVYAVQGQSGAAKMLVYPLRTQEDTEPLKAVVAALPGRMGFAAIQIRAGNTLETEVAETRRVWNKKYKKYPNAQVKADAIQYIYPEGASSPGAAASPSPVAEPPASGSPLGPMPPLMPATVYLTSYGTEPAKTFAKGTVAYKLSYLSPGMVLAKAALTQQGWRPDERSSRSHYQYVVPPGGKSLGTKTIPLQAMVPTKAAFEAWADQVMALRGHNAEAVTVDLSSDQVLAAAHYTPEKVQRVSVGRLHYAGDPSGEAREVHTHTTHARVAWYFPGGEISRDYPQGGPPATHAATYDSVVRFDRVGDPTPRGGPAPAVRVDQEGCFDTTLDVPGVGPVQVTCGAVGKRDTWANITVGSTRYGWNGSRWARGDIPSQTILRAVREAGITVFPGPST